MDTDTTPSCWGVYWAAAALREVEHVGKNRYDGDFFGAYRIQRRWATWEVGEDRPQISLAALEEARLHEGLRAALARLGHREYDADFISAYTKEKQDPEVKGDLISDLFYIESPGAIEALGDDMEMTMMSWGDEYDTDAPSVSMRLNRAILAGLARRTPDFPVEYSKPSERERELRMCARWWKRNKKRVLKESEDQWEQRATESGLRE